MWWTTKTSVPACDGVLKVNAVWCGVVCWRVMALMNCLFASQ